MDSNIITKEQEAENTLEQSYAIELHNITKRFGSVIANDQVSLSVKKGEILCVLGENGSGKTTLMNMISGIYYPEEGWITVDGREVKIRSPKDSFDLGIGMVHQHFKLVDILTAAENIILGLPGKQMVDMKAVTKEIRELVDLYGFDLDPNQKIYQMSVSQKQTVEIVKLLYRGAKILILDEPTAVLTPQEADRLFEVLRNMKKHGCSIILITHKLHEVLAVSDRVSILRRGQYVDTVETKDATVASLTEMMVGEKVDLNIERPEPHDRKKRLELSHVTCMTKDGIPSLDDTSLTVYGGEILGIAGIAGGGQKELLEAIAGLEPVTDGTITFYPEEGGEKVISGLDVAAIRKLGVRLAFVPEDRLGMGLVGSMNMTDNMMLRSYRRGKSEFLDRKTPGKLAAKIKKQLEVVTPSIHAPVAQMSGGNVQKVLVGREIAQKPKVLMVAYPTRGIDINSSHTIYRLLNEQKEKGIAVICVIEDLDVLMELCDRIAVLCGGRISGIVDGRTAKKEELGVLMTRHEKMKEGTGHE
jgi:simple sugar transport system ATP-binding protein